MERVKDADLVIFAGGISPLLEGEEMAVDLPGFRRGDRTDIELPAVQRELISALHRGGRKSCWSTVQLTHRVGAGDRNVRAILQAWYPGQEEWHCRGGGALQRLQPSGAFAVTFYSSGLYRSCPDTRITA